MKLIYLAIAIALLIITIPVSAHLTGYGNSTDFYVNTSVAQTDYQIKINASNATGANTGFTFYTNGTTRSDWADIAFTDSSDTLLTFWKENRTNTATLQTFWIKVPSISSSNTTIVRAYYGNSSMSTSLSDGDNTFPFFDDFLGATVNTSKWVVTTGSGSATISDYSLVVASTGSATPTQVKSLSTYADNYTAFGRVKSGHYSSTSYQERWGWDNAGNSKFMFATFSDDASGYEARYRNYDTGSALTAMSGWSAATYYVLDAARTTSAVNWRVNGGSLVTFSTQYPAGQSLNATLHAHLNGASVTADWVAVRKYSYYDPVVSANGTVEPTPTPSPYLTLSIPTYLIADPVDENIGAGGIELTNGTYLVAWYHGTTEDNNDGLVWAATSSDHGVTWTDPYALQNNASYWDALSKFLRINNTIYHFYTVSNALTYNPSAMYMRSTTDDGETWSAETLIGYQSGHFLGNSQPIQLADKRVILPAYEWNTTTSVYDGLVYYSDDNATTWTRGGYMYGAGTHSMTEPWVVELQNGNLYAAIRDQTSGAYVWTASSTDRGVSWTSATASSFISPRAHSGVVRTVYGTTMLLWNNVSSATNSPRHPFTAGLSLDNMSSLATYADINSGTDDYSNFGYFTNSTGAICIPYSNDTAKSILFTAIIPKDFMVQSPLPIPDFTSSPGSGVAAVTNVSFTDATVTTPTSWNWSFGDGTYSTTQNPYHIFSNAGVYDVALTAGNASGVNTITYKQFITITAATVTPVASFTANVTSGTSPLAVGFTDTSTNIPTAWNWSYTPTSTGIPVYFSTSQNPSNSFTTGNYSVVLNASNSAGFDLSDPVWVNVSAAGLSGWNQQDIMMDGIYTLTLTVRDAASGSLIDGATVSDSFGDNTTTVAGVAILTYNYTTVIVTVTADGYYSNYASYIMDESRSETIYLTRTSTVSNTTSSTVTYYTPWQVRIRIVDAYGTPLEGTNVTVNYVASTLPSTNTSWLISAYGVQNETAAEMVDSGLAMSGTTDSNGGLSFTMFKSIQYSLAITNTTLGISATKSLYPTDQEYVIRVPTSTQVAGTNVLEAMQETSLPVYQLNSTAYNLSVVYRDTTGDTSNVMFYVKWRNGTVIHSYNMGDPGTAAVTYNYTIINPGIGTEVIWMYNATRG